MRLLHGLFGEVQRFKNGAALLGRRFEERADVTVRNDEDVTRRNGKPVAQREDQRVAVARSIGKRAFVASPNVAGRLIDACDVAIRLDPGWFEDCGR